MSQSPQLFPPYSQNTRRSKLSRNKEIIKVSTQTPQVDNVEKVKIEKVNDVDNKNTIAKTEIETDTQKQPCGPRRRK